MKIFKIVLCLAMLVLLVLSSCADSRYPLQPNDPEAIRIAKCMDKCDIQRELCGSEPRDCFILWDCCLNSCLDLR